MQETPDPALGLPAAAAPTAPDAAASLPRLLVAAGLDLAVIVLLFQALRPGEAWQQGAWTPALGLWGAYQVLLWRYPLPSFGLYAMGVRYGELRRRVLHEELRRSAHWLILFAGIAQFLIAARLLLQGLDPQATFYVAGRALSPPVGQALWSGLGIAGLLGAIGLFRCKAYAPAVVLLLQCFVVLNDAASLSLLREVAERAAASGGALDVTAAGYLRLYLSCNLAFLIWLAALMVSMRRRFTLKGIF